MLAVRSALLAGSSVDTCVLCDRECHAFWAFVFLFVGRAIVRSARSVHEMQDTGMLSVFNLFDLHYDRWKA